MNVRHTARKAITPQAIEYNAILAFRSYHPREGTGAGRVLSEYHARWEVARPYGIMGIEAIHRLLEILPHEWQLWAETIVDDYVRRRSDTHEEEGDFPGFFHTLQLQYDEYQEVMPASPEPLHPAAGVTPPTLVAEPSHRYQGEGSRQSCSAPPQAVRDFPSGVHDPTGRGKAPAHPAHVASDEEDPMEYEADSEAEPQQQGPADMRRLFEESLPHALYPVVGAIQDHVDRVVAEVHGRLDALIGELGHLVHPAQEAPPPPPVHAGQAGGPNDPIILDSDTDPDDFEGSSGLSSEDSP